MRFTVPVCTECDQIVGSCDRCGRPLRHGDLSTCGMLTGEPYYHAHTEPAKCRPLREQSAK